MISQEPKCAGLSHTTLHLCVPLRYLTEEILLPSDEELVDVMWLDTIRKSNPGFLKWRTSTFKVNIIKTQINSDLFNYKPSFKYVLMIYYVPKHILWKTMFSGLGNDPNQFALQILKCPYVSPNHLPSSSKQILGSCCQYDIFLNSYLLPGLDQWIFHMALYAYSVA